MGKGVACVFLKKQCGWVQRAQVRTEREEIQPPWVKWGLGNNKVCQVSKAEETMGKSGDCGDQALSIGPVVVQTFDF